MDPDLSEFVRSYVNERPPYVMLLWDTHVQYVSCDTEQSKWGTRYPFYAMHFL